MDNKTKSAIAENIRRVLMFKTLKDIKTDIDIENEHNRKSRRLAVIAIIVAVFCIVLFFSLLQHRQQDTRVLGSDSQNVPDTLPGILRT